MRVYCCLMLLLAMATIARAQREPCLTGFDAPGCGIKVTMDPPLNLSGENVFWVPNQITVDVPMRLKASKVALNSGPAGTQVADQFKPFVEAAHFKKTSGVERFHMQIKSCPGNDNAFELYIVSPKLPYPLAANYQPFECKERAAK
jgi:hypothetical protein